MPLLGQSEIVYEPITTAAGMRHEARLLDPVIVQLRPAKAGWGAIFIFNTGAQTVQRRYDFTQLGLPETVYLVDWQQQSAPLESDHISLTLPAHDGRLFLFSHNLRLLNNKQTIKENI